MAFRLASGLIEWTVDKLSVLLPPQVAVASSELSNSALEDLKRLERTMKRIQSLLLDSPKEDMLTRSEKHRLEELREVAYDAEDLVEEYEYDVLHAKMQAQSKMGEKVTTDLVSIAVSVPVPVEISLRAKKIRERFDEIVVEWEKLRWMESNGAKRQQSQPPTSSLVHEPSIHGRFQDKENVIAILLNGHGYGDKNPTRQCVVLPIVGMGGVGKTTLAQLVYNDPRMNLLFDLKVWVYVSQEFDVQVLTQVIITSITKKPCEPMQLDDLQRILEDKIKKKRLLLVLDDVWNERPSPWHLLRTPFFCLPSCKILVTARNENVAKVMQTIPFYPLRCLEYEDSLQLFKQVTFENQNLEEHANLLEIGREITKKCGGLPLAIKAVGSALRFEPREEFWRAMLESDLWELEEGLNEVLPALRLSYECMPENLKECFMSFSLFPKNCIFLKETTVRFWSSLGFLKVESRRSAENAGTQYFDDMLQRSLLQVIQFDGGTYFVMHDLVRKLAEFVAGDAFKKLNTETLNSFGNKGRYLSVLVNELPKSINLSLIQHASSLRALQIFNTVNQWLGKDISIMLNEEIFQNLRSLRVLNFSNTGISILPYSIGNLKQLHFLGLARTQITTLPESIGLLYNLQTIDLAGCHLEELPKGIKNLVNLRHLIMEKWSNTHMPRGMGNLTNLEILPVFNIRTESGCQVSDMGKLSKLRGELRITGLDNVRHINDVLQANLFDKQHIHVLRLDWSHGVFESGSHSSVLVSDIDHVLVLEALQPQLNLQVLEIYHYPGSSYPKWLGDSTYSRLGKVVLFGNCKISCKFLPPLGQLPFLRELSIQCMLTVEYVGNEFCHHDGQNKAFPSLNYLEFKYMPLWMYWFGVKNIDFCSLRILKIVSCNSLKSLPEFHTLSLEKLVLVHCNELITLPMTLTSLTSLILMGDINKSLLMNITLPSLKSLQIGFSHNVQYVTLGSMPFLEVLVVKGCQNLKSLFGLTGLALLRELEFDDCRSLVLPLDERAPRHLENFKVTNCPGLCYWEKYQMENFGDNVRFYYFQIYIIL
jgi:NB-ARC domain/Rx N-terminal domain